MEKREREEILIKMTSIKVVVGEGEEEDGGGRGGDFAANCSRAEEETRLWELNVPSMTTII